MGACETTPPASTGTTHTTPDNPIPRPALPRPRGSPAARRRQARSSSPLRGCGRSSLTLAARRQDRAATRKDPEEQSAQPGGARSHRARSVRPLDTNGPYGCRDELCRITVCLACGSRSSEPRDRASWTLAPSVHQADIDHGAWSSRRHDQHAYPPIWRQVAVGRHAVRAAPERVICNWLQIGKARRRSSSGSARAGAARR